MLDDAIKNKIKLYGSICLAVLILAGMAALAWHVYDMKTKSNQNPIVVKYEDTKKADELAKKLDISDKTAQQLAERLESIHAGKQNPDVTYYVQAPSLQEAADKTAQQIQDKDSSLPPEAFAKTDRTVVTANKPQQKVDVYKINLAHKHAFYCRGGYDNDNLRGAVSYQCGDSLTTVVVGHGKPAYYEQYKIVRW